MTWLFVLSLTCVTFFNRYLFLEPKTQIRLPKFATRMLKYAAPCLMVSICLPLVFFLKVDTGKGYLKIAIFMVQFLRC